VEERKLAEVLKKSCYCYFTTATGFTKLNQMVKVRSERKEIGKSFEKILQLLLY